MKILFAAGGTMGSVYPLLAIRDELIEQKICSDFIWVIAKNGIEQDLLNREAKVFIIKSAKWRRYFSLKNFLDIFNLILAFFQSLKIIIRAKPQLIITAGSFVGVPVVWAGWLWQKKIIIHQQDIVVGLANKFMASFANKITVTFAETAKLFPAAKTVVVGNPVRSAVFRGSVGRARERFGLEENLPTLLVMGGSQGAQEINNLLFPIITQLILFCQIIQITGKGNVVQWIDRAAFGAAANRYHSFPYLTDELFDAYAVTDLVISRAGLSTLTELSVLGKPSIIIPLPNTPQEQNADYFNGRNAAIVLTQNKITATELITLIKNLLDDTAARQRLSQNMRQLLPDNAAKRWVTAVRELLT